MVLMEEHRPQKLIPASRRCYLEEAKHAVAEGLEVENIVDPLEPTRAGEISHAKYSVNEHDEEEEEPDVGEGGKGHQQGEKQGAQSSRASDQPQEATDTDHSNDSQDCRREIEASPKLGCCKAWGEKNRLAMSLSI